MNKNTNWIQTYTGKKFWPLEPDENDICIEDIAHALSMMCRFNGHTKDFYSVAQHSCLIALNSSTIKVGIAALLHDAAEAYLVDIPSPLKHNFCVSKDYGSIFDYKTIEDKLTEVIFNKLAPGLLNKIDYTEIKTLDTRILYTEAKTLMKLDPNKEWKNLKNVEPLDIKIEPWLPTKAEESFLMLWNDLNNE